MAITIRGEEPGDIPAIRHVHVQAFGRTQEAKIVDALRDSGAAALSLVATMAGQVVGHILFSPISVGDAVGVGLAPLAVLPEHQRRGIGGTLIAAAIERLRAAGCPFVIVLGHADYYPRFGFVPASTRSVRCEWDVPDHAFMVLVLDETTMRSVSGVATYRQEFSTVT